MEIDTKHLALQLRNIGALLMATGQNDNSLVVLLAAVALVDDGVKEKFLDFGEALAKKELEEKGVVTDEQVNDYLKSFVVPPDIKAN